MASDEEFRAPAPERRTSERPHTHAVARAPRHGHKKAVAGNVTSPDSYESLVQTLDGIVWEVDVATFRFTFVSNQAERVLGYPLEQWYEPDFWASHLHRDDKQWAVAFCMSEVQARRHHQFEYRMIAADGRIVWLHDIVSVVVENDEPAKLRGVMIDVTKRKQAEAHVHLLRSITIAIANSEHLDAGLSRTLGAVCDAAEWACGQAWTVRERDSRLECSGAWYSSDEKLWPFREASERITLGPGEGLPGRAWSAREPVWERDVKTSANFPRREAAIACGLAAGVAVPVFRQDQVVAVLEFYLTESRDRDDEFVSSLFNIAEQLGGMIRRLQAEEGLRNSEERYRTLIQKLHVGVALMGPTGRIRLFNDFVCAMAEVDEAEVLGKKAAELFDFFYEDGKPVPAEQRPVLQAIADRRPVRDVVARFVNRRTQKQGWILVNAEPELKPDGTVDHVIVTITDVSTLKRAEEALRESEGRFRAAVAGSNDGLYDVDLVSGRVYYSPRFVELLGYEGHEAELTGHMTAFEQRLHPDDRERTMRQLNECLTAGAPFRVEYRLRLRSGEYRWFFARADVQRSPDGTPIRLAGFITDVSAMKRLELLMQQTSRTAKVGGWEIDIAARTLYWTDETYRICGVQREDDVLTREQMLALFSESSRRTLAEALGHATRSGVPFDRELQMTTAAGELRDVRVIGRAEMHDGVAVRLVGAIQDVTELKAAEAARRESEQRFRAVFETAAIGISIVDNSGEVIDVNPAFARMLGYSHDEICKMRPRDWTHPEDINLHMQLHAEVFAGTRDHYQIEKRYLRKDGQIVWGRLTASIRRGEDGVPAFGVGMIEDITERKRAEQALRDSEERFRTLFESSPIGISIHDHDGRLMLSNPAMTRILGRAYEELLHDDFTHPEDVPEGRRLYQELVAGKRTSYRREKRYVRSDGATIWAQIVVAAIQGRDGASPYCMMLIEDISDRKRAEEELQALLAQRRILSSHLESVREEERARVAREVHDELGQTLTALKIDLAWLMDNLRRGATEQRNHEMLDKAKEMIQVTDSTIATVRRIATELRPAILDTFGLVPALEWQAEEFTRRTGIPCRFTSNAEEVDADPERTIALFRIFQESLTNVSRHANATSVRARLVASPSEAVLTIEDNGVGIQPEALASARSFGLLGMRERAALLGGDFQVTTTPGHGARVVAHIPVG